MNARRSKRGVMLLEVLVYIAVLVLVLAAAYPPLYRAMQTSRDLRRNAEHIVRAMGAGERWREDIRAAVAAPRWAEERLHIPTRTGSIVYSFLDGVVWRQIGEQRTPVLRHVKASEMLTEARQSVTVWRWELELESAQRTVRLRPLFTFQAVAGRSP